MLEDDALPEELLIDDDSMLEESNGDIDSEILITEEDITEEIEETNSDLNFIYPDADDLQISDDGLSDDDGQISDEVLVAPDIVEDVTANSDAEKVGADDQETIEDIKESILIIQQNTKVGFDNLSLIGSVQTGLTAFGIGAIIIYCYIGRFK